MIIGQFHQGSGLGNQLHRLVATRVRAADLGVDWAMIYNHDNSGKERGFKGQSFMDIGQWDKGIKKIVSKFDITQNTFSNLPSEPEVYSGYWQEKCVRDEFGNDIRSYDPEFNFVEDNTVIEGEFQSELYWQDYEKEVNEWLKVEPLEVLDDTCVIGFRGGEFALYPDLFLTKEYWDEGIKMMREINPNMKFEVQTDDPALAQQFFPDFKVVHDIGYNWRAMRYAKYAIISNSSFNIFPRWLREGEGIEEARKYNFCVTPPTSLTISPRYWGRRNTKTWSLPQNFYKRFTYL